MRQNHGKQTILVGTLQSISKDGTVLLNQTLHCYTYSVILIPSLA